MWFLPKPNHPETASRPHATRKTSQLRRDCSPQQSSSTTWQSRDDETDDLRADEEVAKIVAWAMEDVKVTRDDDESFEEAIELVSSEDRVDDCNNSINSMLFDRTVITNVETVDGVTMALVYKPVATCVQEPYHDGDHEENGSSDPPETISKTDEEMKSKTNAWIDIEPEDPKSEATRKDDATPELDSVRSTISNDKGNDEIDFPISCLSEVESIADVIDAEKNSNISNTDQLEEVHSDNVEMDSKLDVKGNDEEEKQADPEIIHVEEDKKEDEFPRKLGPEVIHVVDEDYNDDDKRVLEQQDSPTQSENSNSSCGKIDALKVRLRRMEKKHEEYVTANQVLNERRFQLLESMIQEKSSELEETKEQLTETQLELKEQAKHHAEITAAHNEQHLILLDRVAQIEQRIMQQNAPLGNTGIVPIIAHGNPTSSAETISATAHSAGSLALKSDGISEAVLCELVQTEVERFLSERDAQFESWKQEAELRGRQLGQLMTRKFDVDRILEQQRKLQEICDGNFQLIARHESKQDAALQTLETASTMMQESYNILLKQFETDFSRKSHVTREPSGIDAALSNGSTPTSPSAERMASRRSSIQGMSSDLTEKVSNMKMTKDGKLFKELDDDAGSCSNFEKRDIKLRESIKREVCHMMELETEHLMKTWGAHFQELATMVQNDLDKQRETIAETRTCTFEQVDAESQACAAVWDAKYSHLEEQAQQHTQQILDIKEDQEKAMSIIVETIVNLKMKVDGVSEEVVVMMKPRDNRSSESKTELKLQQMIDEKTIQLESKMGKFKNELQMVKTDLKNVNLSTNDIIQDHEAMQSIIDKTVDLFNAKMETNLDVWTLQLGDLQSDMEEYMHRNFGRKREQEKMKENMELVIKKLDITYVDLIKVLNRQAAELREAQEAQVHLLHIQEENKVIQSLLEKATKKWDATYTDLLKVVEGQAAELQATRGKEKEQQHHSIKKATIIEDVKPTIVNLVTEDRKKVVSCLRFEDLPSGSDNNQELATKYLLPPPHSQSHRRSRSTTPPLPKKKVTFDGSNSSSHETTASHKTASRRSPLPELRVIETRHEVEFFDLTEFESKREPKAE